MSADFHALPMKNMNVNYIVYINLCFVKTVVESI